MKKFTLSAIFMLGTIVLLSCFQVWWLNKLFHEKESEIARTADIAFKETMYQIQADRIKGDTLIFKGMSGSDIFLGDVVNILRKNPKVDKQQKDSARRPEVVISMTGENSKSLGDTNGKKKISYSVIVKSGDSVQQHFGKTDNAPIMVLKKFGDTTFQFNSKVHPVNIDSIIQLQKPEISSKNITGFNQNTTEKKQRAFERTNITNIRFTDSSNGIVKKFLYTSKTINDTIPISTIDSFYKAALSKAKIDIRFTINTDTLQSLKTDSVKALKPVSKKITTSFVPVGFLKPVAYSAELDSATGFIIKKMTPQILISLLLITITILSFVFIYRALLQQQRLAAMKNEFISNITHELKTPIATVSVAIEALKNFGASQSAEKTKEYLDISASELQRLSLLVDKVLKLSMFENKAIELNKEWFDIQLLVDEVVKTMKLQFEKHHAKVNTITEGDRFLIFADKLHITSVVYNLLDNALKYSKENPVIDIQITSLPQHIFFSITDNGIGIPAAYTDKVFDKFFRVPAGNVHNTKGYGLGLSYVAQVVEKHSGTITVQSDLGKGSTFKVQLPQQFANTTLSVQ